MRHNGNWHPGISMHHIPVPADVAGLIFTIGCVYIFLTGIPAIVVFLVMALIAGVAIAGWLSRWQGAPPQLFSINAKGKYSDCR